VLGISEEDLNKLTREAAKPKREAAGARKQPKQDKQEPKKEQRPEPKRPEPMPAEAKRPAPEPRRPEPPMAESQPQTVADDLGPATVKITAASTGQTSKPLAFHLNRQSPVVDAPSIGSKTAKRLVKVGVHTVDDLLAMDVEQAAGQLGSSYMTPETLRDWQSQAALCCRVPNLRGHDAQMLVGCGMSDPQLIANMAPGELLDRVENFLLSEEGERILRRAREPDRDEVTNWIRWCQQARKLAGLFAENFKAFADNASPEVIAAGPRIG